MEVGPPRHCDLKRLDGMPRDSVGLGTEYTGKERDAETGLDYFGARYMSSAQGRFTIVTIGTHLLFLRFRQAEKIREIRAARPRSSQPPLPTPGGADFQSLPAAFPRRPSRP
jgi:hypothetical protein